jgi:hypothetical protein
MHSFCDRDPAAGTAPASVSVHSEAARSCRASAEAWRRQAGHLREHATAAYLTADKAGVLLREADAADRQADLWDLGAQEA